MHHCRWIRLILPIGALLVVVSWAGSGQAREQAAEAREQAPGCAPEKLTKLVTSLYFPGLDPKSFASQPKTLWRWGAAYARLEEQLNPETGQHLLVVIHEPDIWVADRASGKGKHLVDPGPEFVARLPVFAELTEDIWPALELGCELFFFRRYTALAIPDDSGTVYLLKFKDMVARLLVDAHDRPVRIEIEQGELKRGLEYLAYEVQAEADAKLFERPTGIAFEEPTPEAPATEPLSEVAAEPAKTPPLE